MTGVDFSAASLAEARRIATLAGNPVDYLESDVHSVPDKLARGSFDLVYTGIGALCWLPDIRRWARVVAELLRPGGRLFIREGHPVLWSLPMPRPDGLLTLELPYFEQPEPITWHEAGTYVATDAEFTHNTSHEWNHGLGEIVTALIDAGLAVTGLTEHTSVPWEALPGQMRRLPDGEWQLTDRPERLPHSYTLQAVRASV
jgi:SAM-dependent methyltransferase